MAKRKKTKDFSSEENDRDSVGRQEKFKVISGVLLLFVALFLFLSLISYFFSWKNDQSFAKQDITSDAVVLNWGGKLGARLAFLLFDRSFGISSLGIPFLFLVLGLKFLGYKKLSLKRTLIVVPIGIILFSISLGYFLGDMDGFLGSGLGGAMGYYVSHQWFNTLLGKAGAGLLVIFLLIFYFTVSSVAFSRWFTQKMRLLFSVGRHGEPTTVSAEKLDSDDLSKNSITPSEDFTKQV
ncbi:MAG: DNA translocase FtsK 4TM domain-containing protein, partial [Bacteroidales bacterium]|nr:DNA translocase FtsK 4TM domain-containing protein [Bacteroidales bacterium]